MKKPKIRIKHSLRMRIGALLLALLMVLFTLPTDAIASILEVSDYQEMEEENEAEESNFNIVEIDEEEIQEEINQEETEPEIDSEISLTEGIEEITEDDLDIGISEITTEVSNNEFDILIVEKTEGALSVVYDLYVEDKSDEVSDEVIEKIAKKENIPIEDVVTSTLNIELQDENSKETQPEGTVTVSIAIPENMNEEDFALYYIGDGDATPTKVKGVIDDGYFTFERSHFCQFCMISTGSGVAIGQDIKKVSETESGTVYKNANIGWYVKDSAATTFYISTGADLRGLSALLQGDVYFKKSGQADYGDVTTETATSTTIDRASRTDFSGKTIILANDIAMNEDETFPGIGAKDKPFKGTFDGNGHVIRNLSLGDVYAKNVDGTYKRDGAGKKIWEKKMILTLDDGATSETTDDVAYIGLFTYVQNATIKNLGLEGAQAVISVDNPYNSGETESGTEYVHYKIVAGILVAKDLGTTTSLSNVYIYNSKISTRETNHRNIVQAGLVGSGSNTTIKNCYVMKLSLTATTTNSRFNAALYSLAELTDNSNISNTYYSDTTYNGDNETGTVTIVQAYNGHGTNVSKKSEAEFISTATTGDNKGVAATINDNAADADKIANGKIFTMNENGTHPVFIQQKQATTAKVTIKTLHNGKLSNAAGYFKYKQNYSQDNYSDTYNTRTITIATGYASFGSTVNTSGTTGYLQLYAMKKDSGYTFTGWYKGTESKDTNGKTIVTLESTPLSTNAEFVLTNESMTDMSVYATFSGSPYTVSALVVDNTPNNQSTEANYIETFRTNVHTRATINTVSDPYSEWKEYVYEEDGTTKKKDSSGNDLKKTVSQGNIKGGILESGGAVAESATKMDVVNYNGNPINDGSETPYVITWDVKKSGEVTLKCTPASGYSFVAWYESENTLPYITEDDVFLSDSKTDSCKLKVTKITGNRVIKCLVAQSVNIYTYFANDGQTNGFNSSLTSANKTVNGVEGTYYTSSTYGEIKVAEGSPVGKGAGYTLSAKATKGHKFVGWFSVANPTIDAETNDYTKDSQGKYTQLLSKENNYTLSLSSTAAETDLVYYAIFTDQATLETEKTGNILTLKDEGLTTKKVAYQYSGTTSYAVPDWASYLNNGLGYKADGTTRKDDYTANKAAYAWNTDLGYQMLTLNTKTGKGIDGEQIVFKYAGHYTLCIYPSDGSVMYTKDILVSDSDVSGFAAPTATKVTGSSKVKINANGHEIKNVYYQLTGIYTNDTLPSELPSGLEYVNWYRFAKKGQETALVSYNGKEGYITVGANCGGEVVALTEIGWYTFYIKYDDGQSEIVYIKINQSEIDGTMTPSPTAGSLEEGNGNITVLVKYSEGNKSTALIKVVSNDVTSATDYGVKLTTTSESVAEANRTVIAYKTGNRNNRTYLVKVTNLSPATTYSIQPVAKVGGTATDITGVTAFSFTTADATVAAATVASTSWDNNYYAKTTNGTSFRINSNGTIDAHGGMSLIASTNPGHALWTTYNNYGWNYSSNNSSVEVIPSARIVTGTSNTDYILFTYVLHNNTASAITDYKIGFSADTMINTNDNAPVSKEEYGFRICNSSNTNDTSAINFVLIANSDKDTDGIGHYSDTCSTKWFGYYNNRSSNLYNEIPDGSTFNGDSGAAFSYQGINMSAGEVQTISFILGVAPTSALSVTNTNVPSPTVGKEGSKGRAASNTSSDVEFRINAIYYQYASDDMNTNVPYTYTSLAAEGEGTAARSAKGKQISSGTNAYSLADFKARGITYKQFNGLSGMKTMFEESSYTYTYDDSKTATQKYNDITSKKSTFYEEETTVDGKTVAANNTVTFDEPGWYTFLIDYYMVYKNVGSGEATTEYYADRYIKEVDILITADDLNGVPYLNKAGSMVQIFNNSSNLYSVTYQLTDLSATGDECPILYTDWNTFYHTGQGYTGTEDSNHTITWSERTNKRTYQKVNGKNGYKVITQNLTNDGVQGTRQLVFTTAGWYTFRLNYKTYDNEAKSVIRYVKITQDDIDDGGPRLSKNGNTVTLNENNSGVTKVIYQLTSSDEKYMNTSSGNDVNDAPEDVLDIIEWDKMDDYNTLTTDEEIASYKKDYDGTTNKDEFLFLYEYGTGFYYTTVKDNLYKKSSTNSDWVVFTRIGQANLEDYQSDTTTEYMVKANYSTGYRTLKPAEGNATIGYSYDGASITLQNPGWYTFLVTYGDGVTAAEYIQITTDDIGNAPGVNVNQTTGEISLDIGTYNVLGAYLSYATDNVSYTEYPVNESGLSYYLDNSNNYSWYNFCKYGETHFTEINGDDGYLTMTTTLSGDYLASARYIATKAGWYNVYISFMVGGEKKVAVKHVKLNADVAGPSLAQVTSDRVITGKDTQQHYDNRMMLRYADDVNNTTYPITKYAVGYFAYKNGTYTTTGSGESEVKTPKNISTWYRMALATTDVRSVVQKQNAAGTWAIDVTSSASGRSFDIPVDREGYYVVMVMDEYYGTRIYIAEVKDVPILDDTVVGSPKLYVSGKVVTGVKNGTSGKEVAYLKDVTGFTTVSQYNANMATKGNVLKGKEAGTRTIRVVDYGGRVYDLTAILLGNSTDDSTLITLIKKANQLINTYTAVTETVYYDEKIDEKKPGWWVIDEKETALQTKMNEAVNLISYSISQDKIVISNPETFTAPTQAQIDAKVVALREAISDFEAYSIVIGSDMITVVDGESGKKNIVVKVGDLITAGHSVEYFLYSAADLYDISTVAGYRQIRETVWDSWAGISSEQFNRYPNPKENFVLEDVAEGVYTFQIKVDGIVYYVNPIVVKTTDATEKDVVKDYLGGTDPTTEGLIGEAKTLLAGIHKASTNTAPYVSDALYNALESEITKATVFYNQAGVAKYNVGTTLRPKYYKCTVENMVQEAADLHNLMRKVSASISEGVKLHKAVLGATELTLNGSSVTANSGNGSGEFTVTNYVTNGYAKITKMYVAKGNHTTWGSFATQNYTECTFGAEQVVSADTVKYSTFKVTSNGEHTIFAKYSDNVYGFYHFNVTGYSYKYTATYNESTGNIEITIPAGNKVTELQIADGEYTKFTSKYETINNVKTQTGTAKYFDDLWYTYKTGSDGVTKVRDTFVKADKINTNGYTTASVTVTTPRKSLNEHTVYIKVYNDTTKKYDEYFIPVAPSTNPLVLVNYEMENSTFKLGVDGKRIVESIEAVTTVGDVAWVAYAKGDYVTDNSGWNGMLGSTSGVRYISQNKEVAIPGWSSIADYYTFFFKGASGKSDYIILVGGDGYAQGESSQAEGTATENNSTYTESGTNNNNDAAVDDTYKADTETQSLKGIELSKTFDASEEDGKEAVYYKIVAYKLNSSGEIITGSEVTSEYIAIPENEEFNVNLPTNFTTSNGDKVGYKIVTYTSNDASAEEVQTITNSFTVETPKDVYNLQGTDTAKIEIAKVNVGTGADNIATKYTLEAKAGNPEHTGTVSMTALPAEASGKVSIPVAIIAGLTNGVSEATFTLKLYADDGTTLIETIEGTYPIKVNGEYTVELYSRSTSDDNITFRVKENVAPLNGGQEAAKYKITYTVDGASKEATGDIPSDNYIIFDNEYAVNNATVTLLTASDVVISPTFDISALMNPNNDKWTASAKRVDGETENNITFTISARAKSSGEKSTTVKFTSTATPPEAAVSGTSLTNVMSPYNTTYTDSSATNIYAWIYTTTGKLIQRIVIPVTVVKNEKYAISMAHSSAFVLSKITSASNGGKTAAKFGYVIKKDDENIYASGTVEGVSSVQIVHPVINDTIADGTALNIQVKMYDSSNTLFQTIDDTFGWYQNDEISVSAASGLSSATMTKTTAATGSGKTAAKYGVIVTDSAGHVAKSTTLNTYSDGAPSIPSLTGLTAGSATLEVWLYTSDADASKGIGKDNAIYLIGTASTSFTLTSGEITSNP